MTGPGTSGDDRGECRSPLYDDLAAVYDRWLSGDETAAPCLEFYRGEMSGERGPILELGCGTGRVTSMLAASGADVVGLDMSLLMLHRAETLLAVGVPAGRSGVIRAEFGELPFRSSAFSAIILPMRTIGHLLDPAARRATFAEVHRVLRPGGRFVLDHYNLDEPWARDHDGVPQLMYSGPGDADRRSALLIWDRYDYDFPASTLHCTVQVERVGPSSAVSQAKRVEFDFRWFSADEIAGLASGAGLTVESCWGDFRRGPFKEGSAEMIFVLRKY
jgi:SAM-dependent methyltransferase